MEDDGDELFVSSLFIKTFTNLLELDNIDLLFESEDGDEDEAVNEDDGPINGLDRTGVVFLIAADNNLPNLKTNINDTYIYILKKKHMLKK